MLIAADILRCCGGPGAPLDFATDARLRQLAFQVEWQAGQAFKRGRLAESLDMLDVIKELGEKCAVSEPRRLAPFLTGCSVRLMALEEQRELLGAAGDRTSAESLKREIVRLKTARKEALRLYEIAMGHKTYRPDYTREEAQVAKLQAGLGLGEP